MFPADRADELIGLEILRFLRRVADKNPQNAVPFGTEFCAQRVQQESGFEVTDKAVEEILTKSLGKVIGDDTDPYLIQLHHGKRVAWWERDLWWVTRVAQDK
jgi:hypothetical protein